MTKTIDNIRSAIFKRLNTTTAALISLAAIFTMGFTVGKFYAEVNSRAEIMELKNKQTLEIIEMRNRQTLEIIEMKNRINILETSNEKQEK